MLKYTLGALAAVVITVTTAFIVLAKVNEGGAELGLAPVVIFTVHEDGFLPNRELTAPAGQIIELQVNNRAPNARYLTLEHEDVRQLPQAASDHHAATTEEREGVHIEAGARSIGSGLVRFDKPGRYELNLGLLGVYFPPERVTLIVE